MSVFKDNTVEFLIIGGGPTGLGAALSLQEKGREWHLVEAGSGFGGLSGSWVDTHGFTWDYGGHVLFSHYDTFDRAMDRALGPDGWLDHERESWIWIKNRFVPYPFQNNLHRLDPGDRWECVQGLLRVNAVKTTKRPKNFAEWMVASVGDGICDLFMRPYNCKVWAFPPEMMDFNWIGERVAVPRLEQVLKPICTNEDEVSWGPNRTFRFPKSGGTGAIWQALGSQLPPGKVTLECRIERIDPQRRTAFAADGRVWNYRHLISTMPLDTLIRISGGIIPAGHADAFLFSATHVVGLGLAGSPPEHLRTKCWMYFPESHSPYYRVTVFSNYSPNNVARPGEQWSLMAEIAESSSKPVDRERLIEDTVRGFELDRLLPDRSAIRTTVARRIPMGYPTPFLGRDAMIDPILRRFEDHGIFSRGRFGAWKYEVGNMDHSFAQGRECANRLATGGGPALEPTLHAPALVNSRRNP